MSLKEYRKKRNFQVSQEPSGSGGRRGKSTQRGFVVQKHKASHLHYDFRLELGGTLKSWALPKGVPMKKGEKRLAVQVEDHPLAYAHFEGPIPQGNYGAGTVMVWDTGTYEAESKTPLKELKGGKLHFTLSGERLHGEWYLVRLKEERQWLLIRAGESLKKLSAKQDNTSALSGKTMAQLAEADPWVSKKKTAVKTATRPTKSAVKKASAKKTPTASLKKLFVSPMKAKLVEEMPEGDEWAYEVKFDGFRALAVMVKGKAHLISRTEHDLTEKFTEAAEALEALDLPDCILDGEIVALDAKGRSSFQKLQAYELGQEQPPLCYYAFDLLRLKGRDQTRQPLEVRKERLQALLKKSDIVRYSASLKGDPKALWKEAHRLGLEGLIGKRTASSYEPGRRSGAWIKLKLTQQQEVVIGGYTPPEGSRSHFGALIVGVHEKGKLVCVGKVGTGFSAKLLKELHSQFQPLIAKKCPFANLPVESPGRWGQGITRSEMAKCTWLKPKLVCQVKFAEWTRDMRLRQPVFLGLREDKRARDVVRETPQES